MLKLSYEGKFSGICQVNPNISSHCKKYEWDRYYGTTFGPCIYIYIYVDQRLSTHSNQWLSSNYFRNVTVLIYVVNFDMPLIEATTFILSSSMISS